MEGILSIIYLFVYVVGVAAVAALIIELLDDWVSRA